MPASCTNPIWHQGTEVGVFDDRCTRVDSKLGCRNRGLIQAPEDIPAKPRQPLSAAHCNYGIESRQCRLVRSDLHLLYGAVSYVLRIAGIMLASHEPFLG
jgi:hypothetical protein